jgi:DNA repair exonuclease SbcCD ATPase subunit
MMDERLQSILDSVQKTAVSVTNSATDAAYLVNRKATQLLSVGKMNIQLVDLKAEVNVQLREVGEMVYATHTGDPTDSEVLLEKLRVIDTLQAQIADLTEQIAAAKGRSDGCPTCGAPVQPGDTYCRQCGGKL